MAFERLLRLTKKCPGYVVSGLRNANVGIATVTQESFESQYYITRALFGTRSLFTMTARLKFKVLAQSYRLGQTWHTVNDITEAVVSKVGATTLATGLTVDGLSVGKLYDQGKCIKTGCRHFKPVSGWIKLLDRKSVV